MSSSTQVPGGAVQCVILMEITIIQAFVNYAQQAGNSSERGSAAPISSQQKEQPQPAGLAAI
jgi:hypothetical protein